MPGLAWPVPSRGWPAPLLIGLTVLFGLALGARHAGGQVAVDPSALDSLGTASAADAPAEAATPAKRAPQRPASPKPVVPKPVVPKPVAPKPPAKPAAPKPATTLAPAPPPAASLPPPPPGPPARPQPPPTIPLVPGAAGEVTVVPGGVRITFGPDKADLNQATAAALHSLGQRLAAEPGVAVNVFAYAAGAADDPSTPRRVSLSRALAARAVLLNEGVESTRIYVRALGNTGPAGPPDRVDVQRTGTPPGTP